LILGGGGNAPLHGQVGEEGGDVSGTQITRMLFVVEEDVAPNPGEVGPFGSHRIVPGTNGVADLREEFWRRGGVWHVGILG